MINSLYKVTGKVRLRYLPVLVLAFLVISCKNDDSPEPCSIGPQNDDVVFEFRHDDSGTIFLAWTNNQSVIDKLENELMIDPDRRSMHINGRILRLPDQCSTNLQWSWYFDPLDWDITDFSTEVCDGEPQYVEDNLDEFVNVVTRYCPWGARVYGKR